MQGLIGESIQRKLNELKLGANRVIESNHTLVLGAGTYTHRCTLRTAPRLPTV